MSENPLQSLAAYSRFVAELFDRPTVQRSTVAVMFSVSDQQSVDPSAHNP